MKKMAWFMLVLFLCGCVTIKIPKYIQDASPYKKKFYAHYEETLDAARKALMDEGWRISDMANPAVFEQAQNASEQVRQILIFTEARQTPFIFSSRYMTVNVLIRGSDDGTDVEIRYVAVTPLFFKNASSYKNDPVVNKILNRISDLLEK